MKKKGKKEKGEKGKKKKGKKGKSKGKNGDKFFKSKEKSQICKRIKMFTCSM